MGKMYNDVLNFVFLDCTISHFGLHKLHLGLHNWFDCTLRISPAIFYNNIVLLWFHHIVTDSFIPVDVVLLALLMMS